MSNTEENDDIYKNQPAGHAAQDKTNEKPNTPKNMNQQMSNLSGPLWKSMFFFLIPLMISNALQSVGGTVSSILLGRYIGENALAASSAVFPITFFMISFMIGLGSASSVLIGQAFGSGQTERMKATVGTSLTFAFLLGLIVAILGNLYCRDVLVLIKTPEAILESSTNFARILFTGLPILFIYIIYTTFLRGTGDSKTPSYFLVISTILNIVITMALLFGWLGLPRFGVEGVALATIISTLITLVLLIVYLWRVKHPLALDRMTIEKLRLDRQIMKLMVKIGLPTSIQMIFVSLSTIAVISFVNKFGAQATAAYGAVNQIVTYVQMPAMSLGMAAGIFGAQLIGARQQARIGELVKSAIMLNYIIGIVLIGLVYLFSEPVLSLFLTDLQTLGLAKELLHITFWAYMIFGHAMIISGIMRSSGTVLWPMVISIVAIWCVEVPTAYILSNTIGIKGIWMAYPISFTFSLIAQYVYYRLFWRGKTHQRLFDTK